MTYRVKEVFFSLQGEGHHAGRAAVFLRFSGCNLWSGRADRQGGGACAVWCDTDFVGTGPDGGLFATPADLATRVAAVWAQGTRAHPRRQGYVVCTGGEPTLQLDSELVEALHTYGFDVAIETNGTRDVPPHLDWVAVSPKAGLPLRVTHGDELKLVYPDAGLDPAELVDLPFERHWLIPCAGPRYEDSLRACIEYVQAHPQWRLGVQLHKVVGLR